MPRFTALPTSIVRAAQSGAPDAYGNTAERSRSDGPGNPCRHCLTDIPAGEDMLILAHRPFSKTQPYAETGPIFLCASPCVRWSCCDTVPQILTSSPDYLVKGYTADERIKYGTGEIVKKINIETKIDTVFQDVDVRFIHIRSARNNCYQVRVDRE